MKELKSSGFRLDFLFEFFGGDQFFLDQELGKRECQLTLLDRIGLDLRQGVSASLGVDGEVVFFPPR